MQINFQGLEGTLGRLAKKCRKFGFFLWKASLRGYVGWTANRGALQRNSDWKSGLPTKRFVASKSINRKVLLKVGKIDLRVKCKNNK